MSNNLISLPKLVITDIDGVWTDGGMYYDKYGNEWKKFNTKDSAGVLFLKLLEIPIAIITGEETQIVKRRADKLGIEYLYMGVKNKLKCAYQLCCDLKIEINDVAFIGDDLNDLALLKKVGYSAAPFNAPTYIRDQVMLNLNVRGGDGAFREFVELILKNNNILDEIIEKLSINEIHNETK